MSKKKLLKEFRKVRTNAISEMFDNPDKYGIYPTTKFFKALDSSFSKALDTMREETQQREFDAGVKVMAKHIRRAKRKTREETLKEVEEKVKEYPALGMCVDLCGGALGLQNDIIDDIKELKTKGGKE